jgi:hypothetical protein
MIMGLWCDQHCLIDFQGDVSRRHFMPLGLLESETCRTVAISPNFSITPDTSSPPHPSIPDLSSRQAGTESEDRLQRHLFQKDQIICGDSAFRYYLAPTRLPVNAEVSLWRTILGAHEHLLCKRSLCSIPLARSKFIIHGQIGQSVKNVCSSRRKI